MKSLLFFSFLDFLQMKFLIHEHLFWQYGNFFFLIVGILVVGRSVGVANDVPMSKIAKYFMENQLKLKNIFCI